MPVDICGLIGNLCKDAPCFCYVFLCNRLRLVGGIDSGHGGNKELIELVNKEGIDYIKRNFQYSILENYNAKVDDSVILERESWWKETLQSRKFGYNAN